MKDGKIAILVVNPNSSGSMTRELESTARDMRLPPDIVLTFLTGPPGAPASINSIADSVLSAALVLNTNFGGSALFNHVATRANFDAVVVACFSPHPLVPIIREAAPGYRAIGIYEAAVQTANQLGLRFGIVTTGAAWEPILYNALEASTGVCKERCVGVIGTGVAVLDLDHGDTTRKALLEASIKLLKDGAEAIILGCAGMSSLAKQLQDDLLHAEPWKVGLRTQHVPVIDGVRAAIEIAASLSRQTDLLPLADATEIQSLEEAALDFNSNLKAET